MNWIALSCLVATAGAAAGSTPGEDGVVATTGIDIDTYHILYAVRELAVQLDCIVAFTPPPLEWREDLRESRPGYFVPRPKRLRYDYAKGTPPLEVFRGFAKAYSEQGFPGTLAVEQTGEIYRIYPTEYRNEDGRNVPYESILDMTVDFAAKGLSCGEVLRSICEEASERNKDYDVQFVAPYSGAITRLAYPEAIVGLRIREVFDVVLRMMNGYPGRPGGGNHHLTGSFVQPCPPPPGNPELEGYPLPTLMLGFEFAYRERDSDWMRIRVTAQRPVLAAAQLAADRFQKSVSYEDPPSFSDCQVLVDRGVLRGDVKCYKWDLTWELPRILEEIARISNSFALDECNGRCCLFPTKAVTPDGLTLIDPCAAILSHKIEFVAQAATGRGVLGAFCDAAGPPAGVVMRLGTIDAAYDDVVDRKTGLASTGQQGKARGVLNAIVDACCPEASWQLLYDVPSGDYLLHLCKPGDRADREY